MVAEGCSLAAELRDLVCIDRRIKALDDESAANLAISYLDDDRASDWSIRGISFWRVGIVRTHER
jgi:hypothetical protein